MSDHPEYFFWLAGVPDEFAVFALLFVVYCALLFVAWLIIRSSR